jgi:hypothetical protein
VRDHTVLVVDAVAAVAALAAAFRTSTYSAGVGQCVEVGAQSPEVVLLRDSTDAGGTWIPVTSGGWRRFVSQVKAEQVSARLPFSPPGRAAFRSRGGSVSAGVGPSLAFLGPPRRVPRPAGGPAPGVTWRREGQPHSFWIRLVLKLVSRRFSRRDRAWLCTGPRRRGPGTRPARPRLPGGGTRCLRSRGRGSRPGRPCRRAGPRR